jgi:ferredoxin
MTDADSDVDDDAVEATADGDAGPVTDASAVAEDGFVFGDAADVEPSTRDAVGVAVDPSPALDPAAVVRAQLDAIAADAVDAQAAREGREVPACVRALFALAAPSFRVAHGDLGGFAATMCGPIYDRLVAADRVERGSGERVSVDDGAASERASEAYVQSVLARHPDGDRTYEFALERLSAGKYAGCWLTTSIDLVYDGESPSFRRTPTVTFGDRSVTCEVGDQLRAVLLAAEGRSPHNDVTQVANCGGNGLCGTCAVACDGAVDEVGAREERRLGLPPHDADDGLRLACQTHVQGDVVVEKGDGYWGQHVEHTVGADADGSDDGRDDAASGTAAADAAAATAADDAASTATTADPADRVVVTEAEYAGEYEYDAAVLGGFAATNGGGPR